MPVNLPEILADKDFGLRMRFHKNRISSFYEPTASHQAVIAERKKWIQANPERHLALLDPAIDLLDETIALAISEQTLPEEYHPDTFFQLAPIQRAKRLGELWEADYLLLKPDQDGVFRLYAGCLCFPSHWALNDKIGRSMAEIHAPVPGLNEALGKQIDGFLKRIKPGISWERENWGLSRSPELNLHPERTLPRLDETVSLEQVWFRLEQQSLVSLPHSGGILFGIKIVQFRMAEIMTETAPRQGMIRALETMPEPMAEYKDIASSRQHLVKLLKNFR